LQSVFAFNLTKSPWSVNEFRSRIVGNLNYPSDGESWPTWVLSSHDEVRTVTRFGRRADGFIDTALGTRRAKAAQLMVLALPGAACLFQGEELGLPQVMDLPRDLLEDPIVTRTGNPEKGREGCRVALPWDSSSPSFGFSVGVPRLQQPETWGSISVASQETDNSSFLNFTRAVLQFRREYITRQPDEIVWAELGDDVLAFERGEICCIINFGDEPLTLPKNSHVILSSGELLNGKLPADVGVWVKRRRHASQPQ
jgi:alpha-glucosidase